jgi:hypothetical protein
MSASNKTLPPIHLPTPKPLHNINPIHSKLMHTQHILATTTSLLSNPQPALVISSSCTTIGPSIHDHRIRFWHLCVFDLEQKLHQRRVLLVYVAKHNNRVDDLETKLSHMLYEHVANGGAQR